jgi:hypothetical protein
MGTPNRRSQGFLIIVLSLLLVQMLALFFGCKVTIFFLMLQIFPAEILIVFIYITPMLMMVFVFLLKMATILPDRRHS